MRIPNPLALFVWTLGLTPAWTTPVTDYGICEPAYSTGTPPTPASCAHPCSPFSQTCASQLAPLNWDPASCTGATPECIRVLKDKPTWISRLCACNAQTSWCEDTGILKRVYEDPPLQVLDCP